MKIIKAGLFDTVQDLGRYGFQHLGINPGGVMDPFNATVANLLVDNDPNAAVLEMHFPGPVIQFDEPALIALSGGDFDPHINDEPAPIGKPVLVGKDATLRFHHHRSGARTYLAVHGGVNVAPWLGSRSTNLKAECGGYDGRRLQKEDMLAANPGHLHVPAPATAFHVIELPDAPLPEHSGSSLRLMPGPEWSWLGDAGQDALLEDRFSISSRSDRMAILLDGPTILPYAQREMMSAPVTLGTIQWLPDGRLLVLAADHQTTGGYPRVAQVISADWPVLAQFAAGEEITFTLIAHEEAGQLAVRQDESISRWQTVFSRQLRDAIEHLDGYQL